MTGWEQCFLSPYSGPGWGSHSEQGWSVASHSERTDSPYCLGPVGGAGTCQISMKQKYQSILHTCMLCCFVRHYILYRSHKYCSLETIFLKCLGDTA